MEHNRTLLLNGDFRPRSLFPISTVSCQRAIKQHYEGLVTVVAEYDEVVRSPSVEMRVPSVVALREYVPVLPAHHVPFTRYNVFLRDGFTCQYCGNRFDPKELTFDHVRPRCDGGETAWENIVACCFDCNSKKDRFHYEPVRTPRKPTTRQLWAAQLSSSTRLHETWIDFLYWDSEIAP